MDWSTRDINIKEHKGLTCVLMLEGVVKARSSEYKLVILGALSIAFRGGRAIASFIFCFFIPCLCDMFFVYMREAFNNMSVKDSSQPIGIGVDRFFLFDLFLSSSSSLSSVLSPSSSHFSPLSFSYLLFHLS